MYSYVCVCHILSKCINLQTRIAEHTCVRIMTHTFPRVHAFSAEDSVLPEENLAIGCYCHLTNNAKGPFGAWTRLAIHGNSALWPLEDSSPALHERTTLATSAGGPREPKGKSVSAFRTYYFS